MSAIALSPCREPGTAFLSTPEEPPFQQLQPGLKEIPVPVQIALAAAGWMASVNKLRASEVQRLQDGTHPEYAAHHRVFLAELIAKGETIHFAWSTADHVIPMTFTVEDFAATLESLHISWRCHYGPKLHPARLKQILEALDVAESSH